MIYFTPFAVSAALSSIALRRRISDPPTQAQVTAIQDKLNQLIGALQVV